MASFNTDELIQSSFRGVPFKTLKSSKKGGHRLTSHKFINSGQQGEDNGNQEDIFTIKGYIAGADYLIGKQDLEQALSILGVGELIDTYYGALDILVNDFTLEEDSKKHGIVNITISFQRYSNNLTPTTLLSINRSQELIDNSLNYFGENFDVDTGTDILDDLQAFVLDGFTTISDATSFLQDRIDTVQDIQNRVNTIGRIIDDNITNLNWMKEQILNVNVDFTAILGVKDIDESEYKSLSNSVNSKFIELNEIDENSLNEIELSTLQNRRIFMNTLGIILIQSLCEKLEALIFSTGSSFGDTKSDMLNIIDSIERTSNDETLLNSLRNYKVSYIQFITQRFSGLQDLNNIKQNSTTDVYNLSIDLYGEIDRIDELLINNDIVDPMFINGDIKVLLR